MYEQPSADYRLRLIPVLLTPILMIFVAASIGFHTDASGSSRIPLVKLIQSVSGGGDGTSGDTGNAGVPPASWPNTGIFRANMTAR